MWRHDHPTKAQRRVLSGSVSTFTHFVLSSRDGSYGPYLVPCTTRHRTGRFRMPNERTRDERRLYHDTAHDFPLEP